jgi:hypothetical protein
MPQQCSGMLATTSIRIYLGVQALSYCRWALAAVHNTFTGMHHNSSAQGKCAVALLLTWRRCTRHAPVAMSSQAMQHKQCCATGD